ncbi:MAG: SPOR domain-containing protein, partial [Methyloceanibacter sp.]|uniref:SPOR domain-containing protein n=1 Tax=Methyloceanibacter sp. TaxID=1965321 RepID=UPI003C3A8C75
PELAPAVAEAPKPTPEPAAVPAPPPPAAVAAPETETEVVQEEVAIAAIDPVTLPPAANDGSTRYGIEIGSVGKRDELRPLWREYLTKHAALVAGLQPRRVRAPDNRWRLIAGPFANAQDAEGACSLFKRAERPCAATVYAGDAL